MSNQSTPLTKAQLDKPEREHLEKVVTELREIVESDIQYQLEHAYELNSADGGDELSGEVKTKRRDLEKAVEREDDDGTWEEKFERYVMGVGYTIINRLTAIRCMEVRGFIDRPVTQFGASGTTPAAEKLENEKYLSPDEAKIEAYNKVCDNLANEIEILFDADSPYSIIEPDVDIFEELCRKLDKVPEEVWRADDVLGWIYEYYNSSKLEELRRKGDYQGLDPEDVPAANQFYTPHWVVRMLTDNSLSKMYLESRGDLISTIERQESLTPEERKSRDPSTSESPSLADFSTYLVPTEEPESTPEIKSPEDIRVIDPACGSGHFLLYAFDVLERIWREEYPNLDKKSIPEKILKHNLYGVDLDLRACQLATFNLYLKARSRAEAEGIDEFHMPSVGIVCADANIANIESAPEVFDEIAGDRPDVRAALEEILDAFEEVHGLGSLLDVRGTLKEEFTTKEQPTIQESIDGPGSLTTFLENLHSKVANRRSGDSFIARDLKSFLRTLVILSQDYDVALMNPPYGSGNRMPDEVHNYVEDHYKYKPEFYINFFEVCENIVRDNGRIGMIVPRTFMFKRTFEDFREDFIGDRGSFDFLAEYGIGVLDKATVRTAGTVVRTKQAQDATADFYRLHDVKKGEKESKFTESAFSQSNGDSEIQRRYRRDINEFSMVPGAPLSYWVPKEIRSIYKLDTSFDASNARTDQKSLGAVKQGLATANNARYLRQFWETSGDGWVPFAKGGSDAWILPRVTRNVWWGENGKDVKRYDGSYPRSEEYYFSNALTYTNIKEGGKRFGYLHESSIFGTAGQAFLPDRAIWEALAYSNSNLATYLMLTLTTGRHWQVGEVSKIPWDTELEQVDRLGDLAREILGLLLTLRENDFISPYYTGPLLLNLLGHEEPLYAEDHPHRALKEEITISQPTVSSNSPSIPELGVSAAKFESKIEKEIHQKANQIDDLLFNHFGINKNRREEILREIALRTNEDPRESSDFDPEAITEPGDNFEELIKDLLLHIVLKIVREDDDGIVPLSTEDSLETPLISRVEDEFVQIFGEKAEDRLAEVDQVLGERQPDEGAYPNVKSWLKTNLFEYHLKKFSNRPILWRLTTKRLVSDPSVEGFACLIDYHQLDSGVFDRIESRYLEPLKAEYRDRRNVADQRRTDNNLTTTEQAEAAEDYERYESALAQISEFQEAALELGSPHSPERDEDVALLADELKPQVVEFRKRTTERLETLDKLVKEMDREDVEDHFSPTFLERVNENRDEWLDALKELETACKAYSQQSDETAEAHLYDLFPYFNDLVGSTHYGSNGIFFMNYYFSKGESFLDAGEPRKGLEGEARLLAELAAETDNDVELGEEIMVRCNELSKALPSEWQERALEEVLSSGYSPVKNHGVVINIRPLAEQKIVPEVVEDKVL
ncbi:Methyltransferase domain-containing protein [Halogranum rubrum]|uniref:site-specific DNA-methyltransferase (adenine-specific) n=1 Tax=Halogranum rubrum TaxID=553466 RepID=A0A1I4JA80_9EURY|nr:BREX-5 system adenine-specific DNA-methyltransferase PglX [Halogranum rubrum]SFL63492.1 Methyltransferase domain-containing protein [Halogranum rubrum]